MDRLTSNELQSYKKMTLQQAFCTEKFKEKLKRENSFESLFRSLWEAQEAQVLASNFIPKKTEDLKCDKNACEWLLTAQFFLTKLSNGTPENRILFNYQVILGRCNEGIAWAKTPKVLAEAYETLSAILFYVAMVEKRPYLKACKLNILKSFEYGIPRINKIELVKRYNGCCKLLNQIEEANTFLNDYLEEIDSYEEKDEDVFKNAKTDITKMISCLKKFTHPDIENILEEPKKPLKGTLSKTNKTVHAFSDAIDVTFIEEKGRSVVATRDIKPGEIICIEKCFTASLLPEGRFNNCSFCYAWLLNPIPCPNCSDILFCSEGCLAEANAESHKMECAYLKKLNALRFGPADMLPIPYAHTAMHVVVKYPLAELKTKVKTYSEEKVEKNSIKLGYNPDGILCSDDYRSLYHQTNLKEFRSHDEILLMGLSALLLTKLLVDHSPYFGEEANEDDIIFVGSIIFRNLSSLPCNSVFLDYLIISKEGDKTRYFNSPVAEGVFNSFNLLNNSCFPNVSFASHGRYIWVRALDVIPKGEEVTQRYIKSHVVAGLTTFERREQLGSRYRFLCTCIACTNDWPIEFPYYPRAFKCPDCKTALITSTKCQKCSKKFIQFIKKMKKSCEQVEAIWQDFIKKNDFISGDEDKIISIIEIFHKNVVPPFVLLDRARNYLERANGFKGLHRFENGD